jgi:hypothetical protein
VPLTALKDDTDEFIRYVPQDFSIVTSGHQGAAANDAVPVWVQGANQMLLHGEHASSLLLRGFLMNRIIYCLHIQHGEDSAMATAMAAAVYAII